MQPDNRFNIFYGQNGSGKTSVLEAIHILGLGKSFRHYQLDTVVQHETTSLLVTGQVQSAKRNFPVGVEKNYQGKTAIRVDGESRSSVVTLAELLPLQLIHPDSDELISGSPSLRRQFVDWGLFHVEPGFFQLWSKWQKTLKQRNAALKQQLSRDQVCCWDDEYVQASHHISQMRAAYLQQLLPYFQQMMTHFLTKPRIDYLYRRGWEDKELTSLLHQNFYRDIQLGYTQLGPQRDDLLVQADGFSAAHTLSRGEQKLVVVALRLAQGKLLQDLTGKACMYLLDDFDSELDPQNRRKVIEILDQLASQVFLTTIAIEEVKNAVDFVNPALFHVEQGVVKQV